jgi:hypothetical protein
VWLQKFMAPLQLASLQVVAVLQLAVVMQLASLQVVLLLQLVSLQIATTLQRMLLFTSISAYGDVTTCGCKSSRQRYNSRRCKLR